MRFFISIIATFLLLACSRTVYVPVKTETTETVTVRDTVVRVKLEKEYVRQSIPDTTSTLETDRSKSTATWANGVLTHDLEDKNVEVPVKVLYRDRVVTEEKEVPVEVVKEKEPPWYWKYGVIALLAILLIYLAKDMLKEAIRKNGL